MRIKVEYVIAPECVDKLSSDDKKWLHNVDGPGKSERCSKALSQRVVLILKTICLLNLMLRNYLIGAF